MKNNLIGDPSNIDKTCQLTSYSEFLTKINQMVTNARKYYGQNSNMHNASKELLDNAKTAVHDSRDNLKSWLTMSNVSCTCFPKRKKRTGCKIADMVKSAVALMFFYCTAFFPSLFQLCPVKSSPFFVFISTLQNKFIFLTLLI